MRPTGVHPTAEIGGQPEHPKWMVGDPILEPAIHETALIHSFVTVDGGMEGYPPTTICARVTLLSKAHIGHNAVICEGARVCNSTVICGHVLIGAGASISGNSWIKPFVKIGPGAIIGGGSVVTKDVPAHEVWAGNPARFMKLAWTHPDYRENPKPPSASPLVHPFHNPDEAWEMMRPR